MYRCQSALKLVELNERFALFSRFRPATVVDLAAAPGGFAQVALELMRSSQHAAASALLSPVVVAVDQRPIEPLPGLIAVRGNILQHQRVLQEVHGALCRPAPPPRSRLTTTGQAAATAAAPSPRVVDMVLHDGVSVVKGQHAFSVTYAQNQMALSTLLLACKLFERFRHSGGTPHNVGGRQPSTQRSAQHRIDGGVQATAVDPASLALPVCLVSKVLQGDHFDQVLSATHALFRHVEAFKPSASRAESLETYLVATDFDLTTWQRLTAPHARHQRGLDVTPPPPRPPARRSPLHRIASAAPSLFSMPPSSQDCTDARRIRWNCLGCGRTCVGCQPCPQCGPSHLPQ